LQTLDPKRRAFFKLLGGVIGGGAAAVVGYSFISREGVIDEWVTVGPVADLPSDKPQRTSVTLTERGRFMDSTVRKVVWLRRNEDNSVQVLSGACPHMNCTVAWKTEQNGFDCACHISNFDASGKVVSGPSPRPLDALEHRVENGILSLRYQKFRQSLPTKEPIV
jgi:menaquinol-cytochrome c reductase iron-sulfur subunit